MSRFRSLIHVGAGSFNAVLKKQIYQVNIWIDGLLFVSCCALLHRYYLNIFVKHFSEHLEALTRKMVKTNCKTQSDLIFIFYTLMVTFVIF